MRCTGEMRGILGLVLAALSLEAIHSLPLQSKIGSKHESAFPPSSSRLYATIAGFDASGVRMYRPEDSARFDLEGASLVATRAFAQGDVLCSIPFDMCIMSHSSGAIMGGCMLGQQDMVWDCAGDLRNSVKEEEHAKGRTWDVNLAIALLDATCGEGLGGEFWESYTGAYPRPESVTVPFCLPPKQLQAFNDEGLIQGALRQKERLKSLFPTLQDPALHRMTAHWPHMSPLEWAFAMVRSRCFKIGGDLDFFAIVPIIELANHAMQKDSNVRFEVDDVVLHTAGVPSGTCILRAKRAISEGEAVALSYDEGEVPGYSNRRLTMQYGFSIPENLVRDQDDPYIPWPSRREPIPLLQSTFDATVDALVDALVAFKLKMSKGDAVTQQVLEPFTGIETCASAALEDRLREMTSIIKEDRVDMESASASAKEVLMMLKADLNLIGFGSNY